MYKVMAICVFFFYIFHRSNSVRLYIERGYRYRAKERKKNVLQFRKKNSNYGSKRRPSDVSPYFFTRDSVHAHLHLNLKNNGTFTN